MGTIRRISRYAAQPPLRSHAMRNVTLLLTLDLHPSLLPWRAIGGMNPALLPGCPQPEQSGRGRPGSSRDRKRLVCTTIPVPDSGLARLQLHFPANWAPIPLSAGTLPAHISLRELASSVGSGFQRSSTGAADRAFCSADARSSDARAAQLRHRRARAGDDPFPPGAITARPAYACPAGGRR